ncbi:MAG: type II secretion system protein GspG, partial [Planctomycetes bacterium]|nr:type II secretion system protein GspG [Planctomycetota bacterium]
RTDLAALSNGCFVYKIEYNKYPQSLEELLKPTEDWPNGFFSAENLPVDPWGNGYQYKNLEGTDKNYIIWSLGPNGVDEGGKGDDIVKVK